MSEEARRFVFPKYRINFAAKSPSKNSNDFGKRSFPINIPKKISIQSSQKLEKIDILTYSSKCNKKQTSIPNCDRKIYGQYKTYQEKSIMQTIFPLNFFIENHVRVWPVSLTSLTISESVFQDIVKFCFDQSTYLSTYNFNLEKSHFQKFPIVSFPSILKLYKFTSALLDFQNKSTKS